MYGHFVSEYDLLLMDLTDLLETEEVEKLTKLVTSQTDGKLGLGEYLDKPENQNLRNQLLHEAGLDSSTFVESQYNTHRSAYTGKVHTGVRWCGDLRRDIGFTTFEQTVSDLMSETKYQGGCDEILGGILVGQRHSDSYLEVEEERMNYSD